MPAPPTGLPPLSGSRVASGRLAVLAGHVGGAASSENDACIHIGLFFSSPAAAAPLPGQPSTSSSTPAIAVVGGCVADVTARPAGSAPLRAGGSVPGSVRLTPGGVGRNVAAAAARLRGTGGGRGGGGGGDGGVAFISAVGDDALGAALVGSLLHSGGLDPAACVVPALPGLATPAVVTVLDGRGEVATSVADFEGGAGGRGAAGAGAGAAPPPSSSSSARPPVEGVLGVALGTQAAAGAALGRAGVAPTETLVALDANLPPAALAAVAAALAAAAAAAATGGGGGGGGDGPGPYVDLYEPVSVAKAGRAIEAGVRVGVATPNAAELGAMAAAARRRGAAPEGGHQGGAPAWRLPPRLPPPGIPPTVAAAVAALAADARAVLGGRWARGLIVTLGADGVVFLSGEAAAAATGGGDRLPLGRGAPPPPAPPPLTLGPLRACYVPALPGVAVTSVVGAGDALAGGVLAGGVAGLGVAAALGLGAAAAAQVVAVTDAAPALDAARAWREGRALAERAVWWDV